jgi:hypothetical protein
VRTSARSIEPETSGLKSCHTEIGNFDVVVLIEQDILRLKISMANIEPVAVRQPCNDLAKETHGFLFR